MSSTLLTDATTPPGSPAPALDRATMRGFWALPWGHPQASVVVMGAAAAGLAVQVLRPGVQVELPGAPWNWVCVFAPLAALMLARAVRPRAALLEFAGGIPMAVWSVGALAVLSIPGAIWPQGPAAPEWTRAVGFDHVFSSFGFVAVLSLVLVNLALACGNRLRTLELATARFLLVHVGLLLAIGGAVAGSASLVRARIPLEEGREFTAHALVAENAAGAMRANPPVTSLPFELRLIDFALKSYAPTMSIAVHDVAKDEWRPRPGSTLLKANAADTIDGHHIHVVEYIPRCAVVGGKPVAFGNDGAGPAARVRVTRGRPDGALVGEGWLHSRTQYGEELFLQVAEGKMLTMNPPRPRLFEAAVEVREAGGEPRGLLLRVNEPQRVAGWTLYLLDYDAEAGEGARASVVEAVRDPAYPLVALGCWLLIAGCVWYFWGAAERMRAPSHPRPEAVA